MTKWRSQSEVQADLERVELQLENRPDDIELLFTRAYRLGELGQLEGAKIQYLEILKKAPSHFGTLLNLGVLYEDMGCRKAAQTIYTEAVNKHPQNAKAHANLGNVLVENDDVSKAREHYEIALKIDPNFADAHRGFIFTLTELGDFQALKAYKKSRHKNGAVSILPYFGDKYPIDVLIISSAAGGNIPLRKFLDNKVFRGIVVISELYDCDIPLPPHHVAFNVIGDADRCALGLEAATNILKLTNKNVINPPSAIYNTGRVATTDRCSPIAGVVVPQIAVVRKDILLHSDASSKIAELGFTFPLLLRKPGFHTGQHFSKVESVGDLRQAAEALGGDELFLIEFLNAFKDDGFARKFRVMMIDGKLYPLHLAISHNWKVHYFTSDMSTHPQYREEEAKFLENMKETIGAPAMNALEEIQKTLGFDYGGIDFSLNEKGEVLVFEANATMIVVMPDAAEIWDYRRGPIHTILDATSQMIQSKAKAY